MIASTPRMTMLVVGATGSIGQLVVKRAATKGHAVRALVRDARKARGLGEDVEVVVGDLTRADTLTAAVDGVDSIVFTHGRTAVDYGAVRNVLTALAGRLVRVALMTAIGVTDRRTEAHDWKRRGERLVRLSGLPCTIVRPGHGRARRSGPGQDHPRNLRQGDPRGVTVNTANMRETGPVITYKAKEASMTATKQTATPAGASAQHAAGEPGERRADYRQNPYTLVYDGAIIHDGRHQG